MVRRTSMVYSELCDVDKCSGASAQGGREFIGRLAASMLSLRCSKYYFSVMLENSLAKLAV